jgi:hypothetical protein
MSRWMSARVRGAGVGRRRPGRLATRERMTSDATCGGGGKLERPSAMAALMTRSS